MGRVHVWGPNAGAGIDDPVKHEMNYYLELQNNDDEAAVRVWWEDRIATPDFIVAPHAFDSRTNSVIGANVRRMFPDGTLIAVMIHGQKRRERMDMCHWLIENEYLPMFPRYMPREGNKNVPLTRVETLHEMRPILDREAEQLFVCHGWRGDKEIPAFAYMQTTDNHWELLG